VTLGRDPLLWLVALAVFVLTVISGSELVAAFLAAGVIVALWRVGLRAWFIGLASRLRRSTMALGLMHQSALFVVTSTHPQLLWDLFVYFLIAGTFVFGSGLAIVPFLHEGLVVQTGWLTERQFLDSVAVGLITPGPVVITASFAGYLIAGVAGATVGALGVFMPAYLLVVIPGRWILRHRDHPIVSAFIVGVSAAATGAIAASVDILGRGAIFDFATTLIAIAALVALVALRRWRLPVLSRVAEPAIVAVAAIVGLVLRGI
jgi:chromate transporter